MVALVVPDSLDIEKAEWIGTARLHPGSSIKDNRSHRDRVLLFRVLEQLDDWKVEMVALEEPFDAQIAWRGKRKQQTDTAFRLGVYYGMALAACQALGVPTVSYPVTNIRGERGWMSGAKHEVIALRATAVWRKLAKGLPPTDDQLMAMGVAMAHVERLREQRMEAKIEAVRARRTG